MFKVRYKSWDDWCLDWSFDECEVRSTRENDGSTHFLIYLNGNWKWVDADDCTPV